MGIIIGKLPNDEIQSCFAQMEEEALRKNKTFNQILSTIENLNQRVEILEKKNQELVKNMNFLESKITEAQQKSETKTFVSELNKPNNESTMNNSEEGVGIKPTPSQFSSEVMKIAYSGFENNEFDINHKVGIGDASILGNPMANFVVECTKGNTTGYFYPNSENIKSLQFNVAYNLEPVCELKSYGTPIFSCVLKKGVVQLESNHSWKVVQKCIIKLNVN